MRLPTGLPPLEGVRGRAVGIAFIVLTTLAVLLAIGGTVSIAIDMFRNIPADTGYGFRTTTLDQGGNTIQSVSAAARLAGLKDGDSIVAIDGYPISVTTSEDEVGARMARAAQESTLSVRTGNAPSRQVSLRHIAGSVWTAINPSDGMPVWLSAILHFLGYACASWVMLAAALLLFQRRRHDPGAMGFALAFSLMAITVQTANWLTAYTSVLLAFYLPLALNVSGFALFAAAIAGFPDGRFRTLPTRVTPFLALPALALIWVLLLFHRDGLVPPDWFSAAMNLAGPLVWLSILMGIVAQIVRYRRDALTIVERQQFKWVILGFAIAAIALVVSQAIFQAGGADSRVAVLRGIYLVAGLVFAIAPPLGLLVSLVRYRLYDAESAISRSVAYGALTLALLAIFAGSERIIELMGEEYFGHSIGLLASGLGAGIAAVMIAPIHHRVSHWAERRFQKDLLHLRHGLPLAMADMRETASLDGLADAVLKRAEKGVRASHGAIVVDSDLLSARDVPTETVTAWMAGWIPTQTEHLDCARRDPLFPMRVPLAADGVGTVGWLLLGPRPDGSFYGKDEREALAEIAAPVARAIAVARQRTALRTEQNAIATGLAQRIGRLEEIVARLTGGGQIAAAE